MNIFVNYIYIVTQNEIFRTETVKRCLNPSFVKSQTVSEILPKCLMKEAYIKLRIMDEERNANDICLGEVSVPLKKIALMEKQNEEAEHVLMEGESALCGSKTAPVIQKDCLPTIMIDTDQVSPELNTYTLFPIKEVSEPIVSGPIHRAYETLLVFIGNCLRLNS